MKYLSNQYNRVRPAALSATNIQPSNVILRTDEAEKAGGGDVTLTGDYVGQVDVVVDVEIVDNSITGAPSTSEPLFSGIGNGTLTDLAADATVDVQTITIALVNLGTSTLPAQAPFQGTVIEARASGPDGNNITVAISRTGLVSTATVYSLPHDLQTGADGNTGDEWDFGNSLIDVRTGNIDPNPANTPRVRFGLDQQVYRLYKTFDGTVYTYYATPSPVRAVGQGAKVYTITGAYTITVHNGVDPDEVFTTVDSHSIITLYDALLALQSSAMVRVVGPNGGPAVIVNDTGPNGMAIDDLSVYTNTYVQDIIADGSTAVQRAVSDFVFATTQSGSTEAVVATCTANNIHNSEVWDVYGSNSGPMPQATTNVPYTSGPYSFTIPPVNTDGGGSSPPTVQMLVTLILIGRSEGDQPPSICVDRPRLGAAAHDGDWEFILRNRPPAPCECEDGDILGGPSSACLGLTVSGGGAVAQKPDVLIRKQKLVSVLRGYIDGNTTPPEAVDNGDVIWLKQAFGIFTDALTQIDTTSDAKVDAEFPDFQTGHPYVKGDIILIPANGYRFLVVIAGTSAGSAPVWPTTQFDAITSGGVTFQNMGLGPMGLWDAAFTALKTDANLLSGQENPQDIPAWAPGVPTWVGRKVVPTQQNGKYYQALQVTVTNPGGSGGSTSSFLPTGSVEPIWPDSSTVLEVLSAAPVHDPDGPGDITGDITWTTKEFETDGNGLSVSPNVKDTFYDRYRFQMNDVLFAAGIDPENFDDASNQGDGCWRDAHGTRWFEYEGDDKAYLPIQPGVYYHSSVQCQDENGDPLYQTTSEWGFGPKFGTCESKLKVGDKIHVSIRGTGTTGGGNTGYQASDQFQIDVVHAGPVQLSGGQTGNDTLTWSVTGTEGVFVSYDSLSVVPPVRADSLPYEADDRYVPLVPNGHSYICTIAGTSASSPPTFTTDGSTFTDGTATFEDVGPLGYDDNGLTFLITPGAIDFVLGDNFTFEVEGGTFRYRFDGGSWSAPTQIAPAVSIGSDGLFANFAAGEAPSYVPLDRWSFIAEAVNGPDGIRSLTDAALAWVSSTTLVITPDDGGIGLTYPMTTLMIGEHTLPSNTTITLQGSSDNFATTPFSLVIPWAERNIYKEFAAQTYPKFRLTFNHTGSIQWLYLSDTEIEPQLMATGLKEVGTLVRNLHLPTVLQRAGLGADVEHTCASRASMLAISDLLTWAGRYEQGRFGMIPNAGDTECAIVTSSDPVVTFKDQTTDFQALNSAFQAVTINLTLEVIP